MALPLPVEEALQKIRSYGKEKLADVLHEIGEAVPPITSRSRFRLYLEYLTGGILNCVLAIGRTRIVAMPTNNAGFINSKTSSTKQKNLTV